MINALGLFWAIVALIGWGVANAITRTPARKIGAVPTLFYRNLAICSFLLPLYLYHFNDSGTDVGMILFTMLLSVLGYVSLLSLYKAQKTGKIGVIGPTSAAGGALITLMLALVYFGNSLSPYQAIAVVLIIVGIVFSSISFKDFRSSVLFRPESGLSYSLVTALCWGVMFAFMIWPIKALGPYLTALTLSLTNLVFSAIHVKATGASLRVQDKTARWVLLLAGFCGAMGIVGFNVGILYAPISIVNTVANANPILIVLIGVFVYKERHPIQHFSGIALAIFGIILLSLFR